MRNGRGGEFTYPGAGKHDACRRLESRLAHDEWRARKLEHSFTSGLKSWVRDGKLQSSGRRSGDLGGPRPCERIARALAMKEPIPITVAAPTANII
jgi:hypothetical protein